MKIAMPVLSKDGEDSEISEHFGHNPLFAIADTETKEVKIISVGMHGEGCTPVSQLSEQGVDMVFVHDIGGRAMELLKKEGISLKTGSFETVAEVLRNADRLEDLEESCGEEESLE